MQDLNKKLEAILFSVGKKISIEDLARLCKIDDLKLLNSTLHEIKEEYTTRNSPMMLITDEKTWKLTVRENYLHLVKNLVIDTELSKAVTETLAIIAFKYPLTQAELVKIRSNKAYEHVKELMEMQFIGKIKKGRTYDITLTQKFFNYFDLPEHEVKDKFKSFQEVEKVIEEKEKEVEEKRKENLRKNKELQEQLKEHQEQNKETQNEKEISEENIPESQPEIRPELEQESQQPLEETSENSLEESEEDLQK